MSDCICESDILLAPTRCIRACLRPSVIPFECVCSNCKPLSCTCPSVDWFILTQATLPCHFCIPWLQKQVYAILRTTGMLPKKMIACLKPGIALCESWPTSGFLELQDSVIPTCRELGIGIVAYSPLGRGFLTGTVRSVKDLHETDWRIVRMPRFQGENLDKVPHCKLYRPMPTGDCNQQLQWSLQAKCQLSAPQTALMVLGLPQFFVLMYVCMTQWPL